MEFTPRVAGLVALLALLPVFVYGVTNNLLAGAVTTVNVLIIFSIIYLMMSPTEGGHDHESEHDVEQEYAA